MLHTHMEPQERHTHCRLQLWHTGAMRTRTNPIKWFEWERFIVFFVISLGCGGSVQGPPPQAPILNATDDYSGPDTSAGPQIKLQPGVAAMSVDCKPGAREECNAIDDDCNGVIDDRCGYLPGSLQITVGWDSGADIDLYVTDPSGETLYYNEEHEKTSGGGQLDQNARGECRREQDHTNVENAYWNTPAPKGKYKVELHYFSPCGDSAETQVVVSVAIGRKLIGTYRLELKPEQRMEALSFEITS